jgi:hypothetical protein
LGPLRRTGFGCPFREDGDLLLLKPVRRATLPEIWRMSDYAFLALTEEQNS